MKRTLAACFVAAALAASGAASAGPNLVTNGDFNTAPVVTPNLNGSAVSGSTELGSFSFNGNNYSSALSGWVANGNGTPYTLWYQNSNATTQTAFSQFDSTSSSAPYYTGKEYFRAVPGNAAAFGITNFVALDGDGNYEGGIYQKFTNLVPGTVYALNFDWAAAQLVTGNNAYTVQLFFNLGTSSTINKNTAASLTTGSIAQGGVQNWAQSATYYFEASAATEYLAFLALGPSGDPPMALLDDISLTNAPEPSSLALLGIGIAALAARRRRRVTATPPCRRP
jgi:hypothetical protein